MFLFWYVCFGVFLGGFLFCLVVFCIHCPEENCSRDTTSLSDFMGSRSEMLVFAQKISLKLGMLILTIRLNSLVPFSLLWHSINVEEK